MEEAVSKGGGTVLRHLAARPRASRRHIYALSLCLMMLASVFVRDACADYPKLIAIYNDELLYAHMAEGFATGHGTPMLNGQPVGFQKILYSLLIAPAYLVQDRELQLRLVSLINAIAMSSGMIPLYLLSGRTRLTGGARLAVVALWGLLPDLTYTMTIMSESLFMPLALWLTYGCHILLCESLSHGRTCALSCLLGVLTYLLYLCKEVALVFPVALFVVVAWGWLRGVVRHDGASELEWGWRLLGVDLLLVVFATCAAALRLSVFADMGASYDVGTSAERGSLGRLAFCCAYYLVEIVIACGFLPVVMPLLYHGRLSRGTATLFAFVMLLLLVSALVVSATVSMEEGVGNGLPRAHMRYVCYAWGPLLCVLFELLAEPGLDRSFGRAVAYALLVLVVLLPFRGVHALAIDDRPLHYLEEASGSGLLRFKVAFVLLCATAWVLLRRPRVLLVAYVTLFAALQLFNNVHSASAYYGNSHVEDAELASIGQVRAFVRNHADRVFLVVVGEPRERGYKLAETFLNCSNVYFASLDGLIDRQEQGKGMRLATGVPAYPQDVIGDYAIDHVDYLLVPTRQVTLVDESACTRVASLDDACLVAYALADTRALPALSATSHLGARPLRLAPPDPYLSFDCEACADGRVVSNGPGFLAHGPQVHLMPGSYVVSFDFAYEGDGDGIVGALAVYGGDADGGVSWEVRPICVGKHVVTSKVTCSEEVSGCLAHVLALGDGLSIRSVSIAGWPEESS